MRFGPDMRAGAKFASNHPGASAIIGIVLGAVFAYGFFSSEMYIAFVLAACYAIWCVSLFIRALFK